ncbi:MAG: flagellar hook-basal body complex protein [candidate division Zixibacteria bacterium]|nr:flagellar hook-basal body complex protein [candidate division Zixibacteria bacterium]
MMSSLFSGVTGLRNHQVRMNVIGNNIANVNTTGFKSGRVLFQDALVQTIKGAGRPSAISGGTNPVQIGLGMKVATVDTLFTQGGLETTGQITDLAIQGSGFFILSDGQGEYYTRSGAFGVDAESSLVDPATGMKVQGRMADQTGRIPALATIGDITLPFGQQDPAHATSMLYLANNLDSDATESRVDTNTINSGLTGIDTITGTADNGAGGEHSITISDNGGNGQAVNSVFTGANLFGAMTPTTTLAAMGVDDYALTITVDGTAINSIINLNAQSTIQDVVNSINDLAGVDCTLDTTNPNNVQLVMTRSYAGNGGDFNIQTSASIATDAANGNMVNRLFGTADAGVAIANNGQNHTFTALDVFTPYDKPAEAGIGLTVLVDSTTGLANAIEGVGGGGITIQKSAGGFSTGTLSFETLPTQHSTSIITYDSQGGKHSTVITFTRSTTLNLWDWEVDLPNNETILEGGSGSVRFNQDGSLLSFNYNGGANSLRFDPGTGAEVVDMIISAGQSSSFSGLTGFNSAHTASAIQQDGYSMGILEKIGFDSAGTINGIFSNGISRVLAQLTLADFNNKSGLLKSGGNVYQVSANSGAAIHGTAGETIAGAVSSGALESSNVDIAMEFTNMITAQRGFQANARVITTSDNMLDELVNLKR